MSDEPDKTEEIDSGAEKEAEIVENLPPGPVVAPGGLPTATGDPRITHPVIPPTEEELPDKEAEQEHVERTAQRTQYGTVIPGTEQRVPVHPAPDEPVEEEQEGYRPVQEDDPA